MDDRDLWHFFMGAVCGGKHSREELLGMVNLEDAPPDLHSLAAGVQEKRRGPVLDWLKKQGDVPWGDGDTLMQAVGKYLTKRAAAKRLRRIKDRMVGSCRMQLLTKDELIELCRETIEDLERE